MPILNHVQAQCTPDFFITLAQVMRDRIKSSSEVNESQPGENLCDSVVREILYNIRDKKPDEINVPLKNLAAYVDVVHHTGYPDSLIGCKSSRGQHLQDLMSFNIDLGNTISVMAEQMLYWKSNEFDANPLLRICTLVAQHHKLQGKVSIFPPVKPSITSLLGAPCPRREILAFCPCALSGGSRLDRAIVTSVCDLTSPAEQSSRDSSLSKLYSKQSHRNSRNNLKGTHGSQSTSKYSCQYP